MHFRKMHFRKMHFSKMHFSILGHGNPPDRARRAGCSVEDSVRESTTFCVYRSVLCYPYDLVRISRKRCPSWWRVIEDISFLFFRPSTGIVAAYYLKYLTQRVWTGLQLWLASIIILKIILGFFKCKNVKSCSHIFLVLTSTQKRFGREAVPSPLSRKFSNRQFRA